VIRRESVADREAIRSLTARAFAGLSFSDGMEPAVVDALREARALTLSLVAVLGERIVGHVAFSEVGPPAQSGWFALGPVSVEPEFQRRGVGSQIIQAGLQALREQGAKGCVLLSIQPSISRSPALGNPSRRPRSLFIRRSRPEP